MKVVAKDRDGIARAWGEGSTTDQATHECHTALMEYVSNKPPRTICVGDFTFELAD